jgi:hypothetical protein
LIYYYYDRECTHTGIYAFEELARYVLHDNCAVGKKNMAMVIESARGCQITVQHHSWAQGGPLMYTCRGYQAMLGCQEPKEKGKNRKMKGNSARRCCWGWGLVRGCPTHLSR